MVKNSDDIQLDAPSLDFWYKHSPKIPCWIFFATHINTYIQNNSNEGYVSVRVWILSCTKAKKNAL